MTKTIYFDLDGTIANLYAVDNWLEKLREFDPTPYRQAKPLLNMQVLARLLNKKRTEGYTIGVVSWLSKEPDPDYDIAVTKAKMEWLAKHLASVQFDEIHIIAYGIAKSTVVNDKCGILFDDELNNRSEWNRAGGTAYDVQNIIEILKGLH